VEDSLDMMSEVDTILLKVASRCNINCNYCYVYNMGDDNWKGMDKFMSIETIDGICEALKKLIGFQEKHFSIVLHGGEPLLLGLEKLEYLLSRIRAILSDLYPVSMQTNGILITDDILTICSKYRVSIAVSIDGPQHIHDKNRIKHNQKGTFHDVITGIGKLREHPDANFLNAGLLAVIDPASDAGEVYRFFKSLGTPSVDFLYKDGNHSKLPPGKTAADSKEYGTWMVDLLTAYINDPCPLPIRVLDDMMKVLLGGIVSKEGLGLTNFGIIIIDTNGTIMKNDTLKSSYKGADRFVEPHNIKSGQLLEFLHSREFTTYREMQNPTSLKCNSCPELSVCGGGMILHRWQDNNGFDNPSVYCADQLHLIAEMRKKISQLIPSYV